MTSARRLIEAIKTEITPARSPEANQDIREIGRPMMAASISPSLPVVNES